MEELNFKYIVDNISIFIEDNVRKSNSNGVVVGLSGGVDSAVTAVLAQNALSRDVLALIMPCGSDSRDAEDARKVSSQFRIDSVQLSLDDVHELFLSRFTETSKLAQGNLKSRLRMCALYHVANLNNFLVLGTSNKTELELGYFTKYGDGGVDIEPIGDLFKTQVYQLAEYLNIPKDIIDKPPSAGLWDGQLDEEEIGSTYDAIDKMLKGEIEASEKVLELMEKSSHKRELPPTCFLI